MKQEFSTELSDYINKVVEISSLDESVVEKVINTQVAMLLGDIAMEQTSKTFIGTLNVSSDLEFEISDSIKEMTNGQINPLHVLMEILNA